MNVYFLCNHAVKKKLCRKPKIKIYSRANGNKGREEGDAADSCSNKMVLFLLVSFCGHVRPRTLRSRQVIAWTGGRKIGFFLLNSLMNSGFKNFHYWTDREPFL